VQSGIAPILLPLSARSGLAAGVTYGAFALAGMTAPLLGAWSDRHRRNRTLFVAGLALGGFAMGAGATVSALPLRLVLAFLVGLGTMAASTTGTMLAVESAAPEQWDADISVLQSWGAGGQIAGLLVAGTLATTRPALAFLIGGAALVFAASFAALFAPRPGPRVLRREVPTRPAPGGEAASASPARHLHQAGRHGMPAVRAALASPLGHFLIVWLISYTATNAVAVLFPVAMLREFGSGSGPASLAYAAGIAASLPVYRFAAAEDTRQGPATTLRLGLVGRAVALAAMVVIGTLMHMGARSGVMALLALFASTQMIWPLLNVSSNALAVRLHPSDRGESLGLLNACSSLGSVLGSVIGGALIQYASYPVLCGAAVAAVLAAATMLRRPGAIRVPGAPIP